MLPGSNDSFGILLPFDLIWLSSNHLTYFIPMAKGIFLKILLSTLPAEVAGTLLQVPGNEWIELPNGGQLYELPGRRGSALM
jgi:hypothetical protein